MNWRKAQILIPSILVIPSLVIFIYLLFETTKISREKIRQQLAADSAAFIQMGDYTNFLNRTAYVNGPFPYRIFKQIFDCGGGGQGEIMQNSEGTGQVCSYKVLYEAGDFPKYKNDTEGTPAETYMNELDASDKWEFKYDETNRPNMNKNPPVINDELLMITGDQGTYVMLFWDRHAIPFYKAYAQVYSVLGTIEESQYAVFDRLTAGLNFFKKSFYLNAATSECVNNPDTCGQQGATGFIKWHRGKNSDIDLYYLKRIAFYAKYPRPGYFGYDRVKTNPPLEMPAPGLFQLTTVTDSQLKKIGIGFEIKQSWDPGKNFFNVDVAGLGNCNTSPHTCVHARVASQCPDMWSGGKNNCVWPYPTPKYQTRLYP